MLWFSCDIRGHSVYRGKSCAPSIAKFKACRCFPSHWPSFGPHRSLSTVREINKLFCHSARFCSKVQGAGDIYMSVVHPYLMCLILVFIRWRLLNRMKAKCNSEAIFVMFPVSAVHKNADCPYLYIVLLHWSEYNCHLCQVPCGCESSLHWHFNKLSHHFLNTHITCTNVLDLKKKLQFGGGMGISMISLNTCSSISHTFCVWEKCSHHSKSLWLWQSTCTCNCFTLPWWFWHGCYFFGGGLDLC